MKSYIVQMLGYDTLLIDAFSVKHIILFLMNWFGYQDDTIGYKAIQAFSEYNDMIEMFEKTVVEKIIFISEINDNVIYSSDLSWYVELDKNGKRKKE